MTKKPRKRAVNPEAVDSTTKKALKITSVVVAAIFVLIIAWGVIRSHYLEPAHVTPTQDQILAAKAAVAASLRSNGDSLANYQFSTAKKTRGWDRGAPTGGVLEVFAYNNATRHAYLIDLNSSVILAHARFDFYGNDTARRDSYFEDIGSHWFG